MLRAQKSGGLVLGLERQAEHSHAGRGKGIPRRREGKGISTEARVRQGVVDEGGRGVGILEFGSQLGTV